MIIEKERETKLENVKAQLLHGHTVIELHNHRTGSRERIEHDNTFTDGIENHLLSGGYFVNTPWANSTWRGRNAYRNLIGGILLFDNEIPAENNKYPTTLPAGIKMVANGAYGVSNNSAVTEMGTWNSQESSTTSEAITMVYDWGTSQGNGTIASVCLSSEIGGYVGYGNSVSNVAHGTKRALFLNQESNTFSTYSGSSNRAVTVLNDKVYDATRSLANATSFTYYEKPLPINNVSLFGGIKKTSETVDIPVAISATGGGRFLVGGGIGKWAVLPNEVPANTPCTIGIYDISTKQWTTYTFTSDVALTNMSYSASSMPHFWGNGIYFPPQSRLLVFGESNTRSVALGSQVYPVSDNMLLGYNGRMYDVVNETSYNTNADSASNTLYYGDIWRNEKNQMICNGVGFDSTQDKPMYCYRNPLYLATVNNLDEIVTKTSEQTMKIIYTVTRQE